MTVTTISVPFFMGELLEGFDVPGADAALQPRLPGDAAMERMGVLYDALAARVASTARPLVYAGDCCSILGVLAGLQRQGLDPALVFFDAHGDFNTWETTPSGFIGGMPLAMAVGRGEQTIAAATGLATLDEADVVLVDARDLDPGEDEAVAASAMTLLEVSAVPDWTPPQGPLYVHVDVDVVDPAEMPAMNYPAPGGPSLTDVRQAVDALVATGRVAALSFSCWNPALPGADVAARATSSLAISYLQGGHGLAE